MAKKAKSDAAEKPAGKKGESMKAGRDIPVRGLTRRELKEMKKKGLNPATLAAGKAEDAMDYVLALICTKDDLAYLDDQCNAEALAVYRRIMDLTYGRADEEKN